MEINTKAIDEAVLALLYLTLDKHRRAWKGFDWETLNRLHERDLIYDPVNKAKSVVLTEEGAEEAKRLFMQYFTLPSDTQK